MSDGAAPAPEATPSEATPPTNGKLIVAIAEAIASVRRISLPDLQTNGRYGREGSRTAPYEFRYAEVKF
jgi:hypothetical protein